MADAALDANMITSISGSFTNACNPQLVLANNGYYYKKLKNGTSTFSEYTYLMTFNLSGAVAVPNSIGQVAGYLDDQYSMDYYEGVFRIATTSSQKWGFKSGRWEVLSDSSSQVYVLNEVDSQLVVQCSVKDLGKGGETIKSVRFLGDKGYVVTFCM